MNLEHISSILDTPPCPRISPLDSPSCQIQRIDFQLETPSLEHNSDSINSFYSEEDRSPDCTLIQMIDEEEQLKESGKRSYKEFMGRKYNRVTISQTLATLHFKPRKRIQA